MQSSSATTVMVVGFVNAGMMTLSQAVWVIMGANIGTTITGQLIALDIGFIAPIFAIVGVVMIVFVKKPTILEANLKVMAAGYDYGNNIHATVSTYRIESKSQIPGIYTDINGWCHALSFVCATIVFGHILFARRQTEAR